MPNYDIFISYRSTDDYGLPSKDSAMAESLYFALQNKGYKPFFSKYSIDNIGRSDYITLINDAIESAKVFVAVGSSRKNLTSRWVKREISMFSALMMRADEGELTLLTYRSPEFPVSKLPANLADLQSFADEKALIRFIDASLNMASAFRDYTQIISLSDSPLPQQTEATSENNTVQKIKIGDALDNRYTILSKIGQGGMSNVYLAINERTKKPYAIKEIRSDSVFDFENLSASLLMEIDMMKKLSHPGIPEIIDVIESEDAFITVMEYVKGEPLIKVLDNSGPLLEKDVIHIAKQMTYVLKYLQSQSSPIIHRDIKPANIMITPEGYVKLLDFGTAREQKQNAPGDTTCLGTIGYAAPEQFGGMGQTDGRTDIYGLGVTLYHSVTGNNPAKPPYEILPIRDVNPDLSKGLEYIIQKCTQKDPDSRYQSADELLYDLEHIDKLAKRSSAFSFVFNISKSKKKSKKQPSSAKKDSAESYAHPEKATAPPAVKQEEAPIFIPGMITSVFSKPPSSVKADEFFSKETIAKLSSLDPQLIKIITDLIDHLAEQNKNK